MRTLVVLLALLSCGCGVGYNRVLFFTKTNAGIDVEPQPPTAEISIARREGVIAPTFEGGQTLPVMASFTSSNGAALRLIQGGVGMTFSTGAAALAMARNLHDLELHPQKKAADGSIVPDAKPETYETEARVLVSAVPKPKPSWFERVLYFFVEGPREPYGKDEMVPLVFGTDSTLGLKAFASGGAAGPTLQFGFRRKEAALAPVTISDKASSDTTGKYRVDMPSLIATVDNDFQASAEGEEAKTDLVYVQYFATGKAATYLALQPSVRKALVPRILPGVEASTEDLVEKNRGLAEQLHSKTMVLDPADADQAELVSKLYQMARLVEYSADISGFDQMSASGKHTALVKRLGDLAKKPMADESYTGQLNTLLGFLEANAPK